MNDIAPIEGGLTQPQDPALPLELQIYFNEQVYARVLREAKRMANAQGVTPRHLIGKEEACFFVVEAALTWRLRPMGVAKATYQTPGGDIGFMGSLVTAIIEASGRLEPGTGGVRYEHFGDWSHVQGKFEIKQSDKGKYASATWTDADAAKGGCGVTIRARLRGEKVDREFSMRLTQAYPRNSTLWATDPQTQLVYLATRRFASLRMPAALMGFRDPIEDTPATEVDMGDAHIEPPAQEIAMPTEKKSEPEESISTGLALARNAEEQLDIPTITPGALAVLRGKLSRKGQSVREALLAKYHVSDECELPMSVATEANAWVDAQESESDAPR